MNKQSKILYGGFEGNYDHMTESAESLGELIQKNLQTFGSKVLLVRNIFFLNTYSTDQ